jgi:hypothetical protein
VGIYFTPQANTYNSHEIFLTDFEAMVKTLKARGINTIVFDMNYSTYHFKSDLRLDKASYPLDRGFTPAEAHRMAEITRGNGMQVMVALQVLTHSVGNVFPFVYPEYMLPGKAWKEGTVFKAHDFVQHNGRSYRSVTSHTSATGNAPPAKGYWEDSVLDTRDPFNKAGEAVVFKMIDELITTFTVNGVKPEGFHIGSDELGRWYEHPEQETGKSSAQIYAMAIANAYNHIKASSPNMEVIMWGDMLDPYWNGSTVLKNTAAAIDLIPKDLIIADWRYSAELSYRYDSKSGMFTSVREFLNKGFRVWPTSWADEKGATELVWTGNMEQARTGKVMGHLHSAWLSAIVPELRFLLNDQLYHVPDSVLSGFSESDKPRYRQYYRGLADSIIAVSNLIGLKQCRGTNYFCGTYPNCLDSTQNNGVYGSEYRSYYCNDNQILYTATNFPSDFVAYWKLNEDASDITGRYNGTLINGATIINDLERGQVAFFAGSNDYIMVKDSRQLDMGGGSFSIGAWFKAGAASEYGMIISRDPDFKEYTLALHADGRLQVYTSVSNSNIYRCSTTGISYRDNKWHHVMVVFDSKTVTINFYIDGALSNGDFVSNSNTSVTSTNTNLYIGNNNGSSKYQFKGSIDDVMIYNRVLSPAEVTLVYRTQQTGLPVPAKLRGTGFVK